jgi:hypothetical protein
MIDLSSGIFLRAAFADRPYTSGSAEELGRRQDVARVLLRQRGAHVISIGTYRPRHWEHF